MAKTFKEMKKENDLSIRIKLIILAVSLLVGFVTFLALYYTDAKVSSVGVGLTVFFMLFGASYLGFSAYVKDITGYIAGAVSLVAGLITLLAMVIEVKWFIWLLSAVVFAIILAVTLLVAVTPALQVQMKNDDPEYKDYKQRRAEKEALDKPEEEPLPELKSFKDED